jgi:hypothetical protein
MHQYTNVYNVSMQPLQRLACTCSRAPHVFSKMLLPAEASLRREVLLLLLLPPPLTGPGWTPM